MFRKYYKEANDSIKPDEAFVNIVIENALRRKPPLTVRYTRYISAAAAAVIVVSGAVISMPVWERMGNNEDGVIVCETVRDEDAAKETPNPSPAVQNTRSAAENGAKTAAEPKKSAVSDIPAPKQPSPPSQATEKQAVRDDAENAVAEGTAIEEKRTFKKQIVTGSFMDDTAQDTGSDELPPLKTEVAGAMQYSPAPDSAPQDMSPYAAPALGAGSGSEESSDAAEDSDIPAPAGYYCTNASPNGYTFANDTGAVITVTVNYGGEEREPYIEENGEDIYAVFTSFGLSVTINAHGAERAAVEEIITSLR